MLTTSESKKYTDYGKGIWVFYQVYMDVIDKDIATYDHNPRDAYIWQSYDVQGTRRSALAAGSVIVFRASI
ncbi:unnamed protein product [Lathyrus sativus]|nr:unnamed protein product [Lathyrus sativus]